ncbi:hypothetical protein ACFL2Q_11725 [Thermodesulfobacteriota bacterium]
MRRVKKITKVTRSIKVHEILRDLQSDRSDEWIMKKYDLSWGQLAKVYSKLYYAGHLSEIDLAIRLEMRAGRGTSHIPLVQMTDTQALYECNICGFTASAHFSVCPICFATNLRRLTRKSRRRLYAASGVHGAA